MLHAPLREEEICHLIGVPVRGDLALDGVATFDTQADRCLYFLNGPLLADTTRDLGVRRDCLIITSHGACLDHSLPNFRVLEVAQPRQAIAKVLGFIRDQRRDHEWLDARQVAADADISPLAQVIGNVDIGSGVVIEPFCMVGPDVAIGAGTVLQSGVRVFSRVRIGEHCVIGTNSVIGSNGYGFVRDETGNKLRIPHLGGVVIGAHVEIGAIGVVARGTIAPTTIADHVKIDDNVHVAHNARIRRGASITGGVVIGGSAVVGADAWIGINSSVRNGRQVGRRALVGMDASVQQDVAENCVVRAPRPDVRPRASADDDGSIGF